MQLVLNAEHKREKIKFKYMYKTEQFSGCFYARNLKRKPSVHEQYILNQQKVCNILKCVHVTLLVYVS